ncbi:MAG: hypothetical protein ACRDOL_20870, partial [Streptosporangiaceae bacterium]
GARPLALGRWRSAAGARPLALGRWRSPPETLIRGARRGGGAEQVRHRLPRPFRDRNCPCHGKTATAAARGSYCTGAVNPSGTAMIALRRSDFPPGGRPCPPMPAHDSGAGPGRMGAQRRGTFASHGSGDVDVRGCAR